MDSTVRSTANNICAVPYKNNNYISVVAQPCTSRYDQQPTAFVLYHIKNSYIVAQPWTSWYDQQPTAFVMYHINKIAIIFLLSLRRGHHGTINSQQHLCCTIYKQQLYFCCRSAVDTTVRSIANIIYAVPYKNSNYISDVAQTWTPRYDQQPTAPVLYHIKIAILFLLSLRRGHHGTINSQQHSCCTI